MGSFPTSLFSYFRGFVDTNILVWILFVSCWDLSAIMTRYYIKYFPLNLYCFLFKMSLGKPDQGFTWGLTMVFEWQSHPWYRLGAWHTPSADPSGIINLLFSCVCIAFWNYAKVIFDRSFVFSKEVVVGSNFWGNVTRSLFITHLLGSYCPTFLLCLQC